MRGRPGRNEEQCAAPEAAARAAVGDRLPDKPGFATATFLRDFAGLLSKKRPQT